MDSSVMPAGGWAGERVRIDLRPAAPGAATGSGEEVPWEGE